MNNAPDIGKCIKQGLKNKGWKQKDLASYMNKTSSAISEWVTNKSAPAANDLIKVAELLDIVDLLFSTGNKTHQIEVEKVYHESQVDIAKAIKVGREAKGWTQKTLSEKLDVNLGLISKWECGEKIPRGDTLVRIIDCLEIEGFLFPRVMEKNKEIDQMVKTFKSAVSEMQKNIDRVNTSIEKWENLTQK